jgi:hypothetical protein
MSREVTLFLEATPDAVTGAGYGALERIEDGRSPDGYGSRSRIGTGPGRANRMCKRAARALACYTGQLKS